MRDPFGIELAGQTVEICSLYEYTEKLCRDYRSEKPTDIVIRILQEDIERERGYAAETDAKEGRARVRYSDAYLESLAVYRKIAEAMIDRGTLLFHGSALALDGEGYIFTAQSGTGKSTHARLWRERFGGRAVTVNDDKPLLQLTEDGVFVCGTPWNGKHHLGTNTSVPVKAICILTRDTTNHIERIDVDEAFAILYQQTYRSKDPLKLAHTIDLLNRMAGKVALYRLGCNMDMEAAEVAYNAMKG